MTLVVEPARETDWPAIADLTVSTYTSQGWAGPEYQVQLADVAGRAAKSELLVARLDGVLVGSVALVLDGEFGEVTEGPDEAAFRMLVVDATVRGRGIGEALVRACLQRAAAAGKTTVVLSTDPRMHAAHRLYERLGFTRLPERDWSLLPGIDLLVYRLGL
ncbi:GNAT family N-acetyltransferase [Klenkia sp. PcliD-1-E]|uniref:GNAT family N-acetyltransferase n=1 Tax=Klenkia sp. PcliD-1-E TaxID=2954492 RepID=UPI00209862E3|nr:GNAT family N-acetyltransferase [Klenkia sp. PcliD-1-E]MCO7220736.1 GNAT family N-acetyltransferase [Klenkia sp. PcliD-1-E]